MRNCVICDICQKKICRDPACMRRKDKPIFKRLKKWFIRDLDSIDLGSFVIEEIDICPECYQELIETVIEKRGIKQ